MPTYITGDGDDNVTASDRDDLIKTNGGNDTITARRGNDVIYAGDGDDFVDAGRGNDTVYAGDGHDFVDGGEGRDVIHGGAGNDTVEGGDDDDVIRGGSGDDSLSGGDGDDDIDGGSDSDIIDGGAGADRLFGGSHFDFIATGTGSDLVYGGSHDDYIYAAEGSAGDRLYGDGYDSLDDFLAGRPVTTEYGNDQIVGGMGNDVIYGDSGTNGPVGGDDYLVGGGGNDTIHGEGGNDSIDGGDGRDTLRGGYGDDYIVGGRGADVLTGGAGRDRFVQVGPDESTRFAPDRITDFARGEDRIDLTGMVSTKLAWGGTTPTPFGVWYSHSFGQTNVFASNNGDTTAEIRITLDGIHHLTPTDFWGVMGDKPPDIFSNSDVVIEDDILSAVGNVLANDSGDVTLHVTAVSFGETAGTLGEPLQGQYGTLVLDASGAYTYTLDNDLPAVQALGFGEAAFDTFTYTAADAGGGSSAELAIQILGRNDAPTADSASIVTNEDEPVSGALPAATDIDGDFVVYSLALQAENGTAVVNFDGSFSYTPNAGFSGTDSFVFRVSDWNTSNDYTATVTVIEGNEAPFVANYGVPAGIVLTPIGPGISGDGATGMVIQPDGKIILAGVSTSPSTGPDFSVARYNSDGTFDTTFGDGGIAITPVSFGTTADTGTSVALQADGKVLVAGVTLTGNGLDFTLLRYDANGTLDTSFGGGDGIVITAVGPGTAPDQALHLAVQSDGKIVLVGTTQTIGVPPSPTGQDIALVRYNADGSLDTTFGSGGIVITPAAPGAGSDAARAVLAQANGGILVAGSAFFSATADDFALLRYTSAGVLDTTFGGGDGIVTTAVLPTADASRAILEQPDGRIVIAGTAFGTPNSPNALFALARYLADGTPDATFGVNGVVTTAIGAGSSSGASVAQQADGKLLVAGSTTLSTINGNDFAIVRYNQDGSVDTTFGTDGIVVTAISQGTNPDTPFAISVQADGKIVVGGNGFSANGGLFDFAVARYNADGTLDGTFRAEERLVATEGTSFSHTVPEDRFADPDGDALSYEATQSDGSDLPAWLSFNSATRTFSGVAPPSSADTHVRVTATDSGGLSASYAYWIYTNSAPASGGAGFVTTNVASVLLSDQANGVALQTDGKIVAVGLTTGPSTANTDIAVVRYTADGTLDLGFGGGDGIVTINLSPVGTETGRGVVLQQDGKIIVAGTTTAVTGGTDIALGRLNADGTLDLGFGGGDGIVTTGIAAGPGNDTGNAVTLQADGKILVTGMSNGDLTLVRYNTDGSLDTTFDLDGVAFASTGPSNDEGLSVKTQSDGKTVVSGYTLIGAGSAFLVARFNVDGSRDATFGTNGVVVTDITAGPTPIPPFQEAGQALAILPDGRILVVGQAPTATSPSDIALVRYLSDGSLDTSFGTGGIVTTAAGIAQELGFGVAVQPDGRIVVAGGNFTETGGPNIAVLRYNADGTLDTTFGSGGIVTTTIAAGLGSEQALSVLLQPDGRIVIGGLSHSPAFTTTFTNDFTLVRYNADGSLDTTFGGIGSPSVEVGKAFAWTVPPRAFVDADTDSLTYTITNEDGTPLPSWLTFNGTTLSGTPPVGTTDFTLLVTATDPWGAAAQQLLDIDVDDGENDAPFVANYGVPAGIVHTPIGSGASSDIAGGMVLQPDGKILLAGQSSSPAGAQDFAVARYNTDGTFDTTFGNGGVVITPANSGLSPEAGTSVALQPDGKVLVAGWTIGATGVDFMVVRYNANGSLDTTFGGGDGIVTTPVGATNATDQALHLAVDGNGKIVVVGSTQPGFVPPGVPGGDIALVRYNADGSLDATFGAGGVVISPLAPAGGPDSARAVLSQPDDGVLIAGSISFSATGDDFALVRYTSTGVLDTTFGGGDGIVTTAVVPAADSARAIVQQPDGRIVIAGTASQPSGSDFALARYNADGTPDMTFGAGGVVTTSIPGGFTTLDTGTSIALQADGKLLVGGFTTAAGGNDFAIVRYTANGTVDATFGSNGVVITNIGISLLSGGAFQLSQDTAVGIAVQADGKIVLGGHASAGTPAAPFDFALARYNANGTLDATFRAEERLTANEGAAFSHTVPANRFADPDGDALTLSATSSDGTDLPAWLTFDAATRTLSGTAPPGSADVHVRVTATDPDGLSASYAYWIYTNAAPTAVGPSGIVTTNPLTPLTNLIDQANAVALQSDGKILLAGVAGALPGSDTTVVRYNADGSLDLTFGGGDGIATLNLNPSTGTDTARGLVVLADGRILVAGTATTPTGGNDITLSRLNADGTLDSSFGGGDGIVITAIAPLTGNDAGNSITLQADGKILVAGTTTAAGSDVVLVRYNADGTLDTTFDLDGFAIAGLGFLADEAFSVQTQPDGKIVVSGYTANGPDPAFLIARFNANGSLDSTFGTNGLVTTNVGAGSSQFPETAQSIVIQPDGRIVAVGWAPTPTSPLDIAVVRYNADGTLDTTFGTGGIVRTAPGIALDFAFGVALQPDGRLVVASGTFTAAGGPDIAVLRYNPDGSLDTTFGGDGIVTTAIGAGTNQDAALSVVLQPDGRIVIAGFGASPGSLINDFALVRYNADGSLDATFGGIGNPTVEVGKAFSWVVPPQAFTDVDNDALTFSITMTDGSALPPWLTFNALNRALTGTPPDGATDLALRVTATDPSGAAAMQDFVIHVDNVNDAPVVNYAVPAGIVRTPIGPGNSADLAAGMLVQPDGKIVLAGQSSTAETSQDFTVVRYNADGSFDTTFGGDGIVATPTAPGPTSDQANSVALQSDGKIVVAGITGADFGVARYNVDGSLDTTFGGDGIVTTAIGPAFSRDEALSVTVQSDGKIVVAGSAQNSTAFPPPIPLQTTDIAVVRYNADGSLDTTFGGGDGVLTTEIGTGVLADVASAVLVQPDGGIVVAGFTALTSIPNMITDFALVRYTASGALDTTFGGDGIVTTAVGPANAADQARSILQQPDGRIVVVGQTAVPGLSGDFALARYNVDGTPDATFGTNGVVVHSVSIGGDIATGVVRQADGKLLVGGWSGLDFAIVRYTVNGTVDTTFGTNGVIMTSVGPGGDTAIGIALQADGKIVVGGHGQSAVNGQLDFALVRYNADGSLDATFRAEERLVATEGTGFAYTIPADRFVDPDGDALTFSAAQTNGSDLPSWLSFDAATRTFSGTAPSGSLDMHVRVTATDPDGLSASNAYWIYTNTAPRIVAPSGALSTNFVSATGFSGADFANAVALQPDGRILLTGSMTATNDTPVARYNADGSLDLRFSGDGMLQLNTNSVSGADSGRAIVVQPDGRILVASNSGSDIAVTRLNADGVSLDGSFGGGDGIAHTNIPPGTNIDTVQSMTLQADGKIVVAGRTTAGTENQLVVVRYNADGSLDTTFDTDGIAIAAVATDADEGLSVKTQTDGKIVVSGYSTAPTTLEQSILVARFDTNGSLDASFDGDGIVTTNVGLGTGTLPIVLPGALNSEAGQSLAIQVDGRIVVAGYAPTPSGGTDIALVRYNTDGSLDATFGTGGIVTTAVSANPNFDRAFGLALQPDGRIVVAGSVITTEGGGDVAVLRYNSDGTLDTTFGGDGIVTVAIGPGEQSDQAAAIAIQADGRIVVAGSTLFALNSGTSFDFTAVRLNPDGSLDTTFGGIGSPVVNAGEAFSWTVQRFFTDADSDILTYSIAMTDGSALPAWATFNGTALNGTAPLGAPDLALRITATDPWGASATQDFVLRVDSPNAAPFVANYGVPPGIVTTPVTSGQEFAGDFVAQPDGKIVLVGQTTSTRTNQDFALARYNVDGSLDTTFAGGGILVSPISTGTDGATGVAVQSDGKILAAGSGGGTGGFDFALARYNADGTLDTAFGGGDGIVTTAVASGTLQDGALAVTVQSDGKIVAVGSAQTSAGPPAPGSAIAIVRYNADGSLDTTFGGGDGIVTTDIVAGTATDGAQAVLVQADGRIVVAGFANFPTTTTGSDFVLARYTADGVLDASFGGGDGIVTTAVSPANGSDGARALLQLPDGRFVVVGQAASDVALARYTAEGVLDTTFGTAGVVTTPLLGVDAAAGVVRLSDGKLLVGGWSVGAGDQSFAIVRYNENGSPDPTFGSNGVVLTSFGPTSAQAVGIEVLADGKIVLGGNAFSDFAVARYNADGSLDATFRAEERIAATEGVYFSYSVPADRFADPDGDVLTYSAAQSDGSDLPAWLFFEPATRSLNGMAPSGSPDVHVRVTATDPAGLSASYAYWIYTNSAPTALAPSGIVATHLATSNFAAGVALQADGKIVLTGSGLVATQDTPVVRYNTDGSLDLTFAGDGAAAINTNAAPLEQGRAVAVQPDGAIVVASTSANDIAVSRLTAGGSPDGSFGGGDGFVTSSISSGADAPAGIALQADGRILVAGRATSATGNFDLMLARYTADGVLDSSFGGGDGIVVPGFNPGAADEALSVKTQTDGKIVVSGYSTLAPQEQVVLVARFNVDGSLDTSFDGDGIVTTDLGPGIGGFSTVIANIPFEAGQSLAIQPDGRIVVVGFGPTAPGRTEIALLRYNADGSLDTTFGTGGVVTTAVSATPVDRGVQVALQDDGRIVVGAAVVTPEGGPDFGVLRYDSSGALDTTFGGGDGVVTIAIAPSTGFDFLNGLTIQADGRIVVVGSASLGVAGSDAPVVRLNPDGSLDTSFGGIGAPVVDAGQPFSWTVQRFFADADGDPLTYTMTMADGSPLPSWATLTTNVSGPTPLTTLSGTVPLGTGSLALRLTATDPAGADASQYFVLGVNDPTAPPDDGETFAFGDGFGAAMVTGFTAGDASGDVIDLSAMTNPDWTEFAQIAARTTDGDVGAVIDLGDGNSITLVGVTKASLTANDFDL